MSNRRSARNNRKEGVVAETEGYVSGFFRDLEKYIVPVITVVAILGLIAFVIYLITREIYSMEDGNDYFDFYFSETDEDSYPYLKCVEEIMGRWDSAKYGDEEFPIRIHNCSNEMSGLTRDCRNTPRVPALINFPWKSQPYKNGQVYDGNIDVHSISVWMNGINSKIAVV